MSLVWINGELIEKNSARISPFDHGFLFGDGVWEPFRIRAGQLERADEHLRALFAAAEALAIDIPLSQTAMRGAIEDAARANQRTDGYIRAIATRGPGTLGPDPRKLDPQIVLIAEEYQPFPRELYEHGLHAIVAPIRLDSANPCDRIRVLGNPKAVLAKRAALQAGCLEAIFRDQDDRVAGATEGTVFCVRDGAIIGPAAEGIRERSGALGVPFEERFAALDELRTAEEAFLIGTACGTIAIIRLDGQAIGAGIEGPVTRRLRLTETRS